MTLSLSKGRQRTYESMDLVQAVDGTPPVSAAPAFFPIARPFLAARRRRLRWARFKRLWSARIRGSLSALPLAASCSFTFFLSRTSSVSDDVFLAIPPTPSNLPLVHGLVPFQLMFHHAQEKCREPRSEIVGTALAPNPLVVQSIREPFALSTRRNRRRDT